jgi:hypothetical protein
MKSSRYEFINLFAKAISAFLPSIFDEVYLLLKQTKFSNSVVKGEEISARGLILLF